jgi:serine/threonine-protein kinase
MTSVSADIFHFIVAYERVLLDLEVGRTADARKVADRYLEQRSAFVADDLSLEPTILIHAARLAAGGLSRPAFDGLRDAWLARDDARIKNVGLRAGADAGTRWVLAHALAAQTPKDAEAALAARPDVQPLVDELGLTSDLAQPIGRTYLLAGKVDDAVPFLTKASAACRVLFFSRPMFSTWAAFDLGRALEARSDTSGACAAYGRVLARWGSAKPPSLTAAAARARSAALRCAR